ncbi:ribosomal protein S18-alanine N-acetyltransferase [Rheinheimera sp. WS51]|uniref:ribosomal protein S18-alanine N-acetyltransferase n=1 Tax=Rheinheimera sp. WS51 TaxID=3425886 RepID=UPI003D8E9FC1
MLSASASNENIVIRLAKEQDAQALFEIEQQCFTSDQISLRSFKRFIPDPRNDLILLEKNGQIAGYFLILYRAATSLARLYSIAVNPAFRKQGLAEILMQHAEQAAAKRFCVLLRLEVRPDNKAAITLYRKLGYSDFAIKHDFYEDHADAICMQKQVIQFDTTTVTRQVPYIAQTTPFTCGPACLLMVFNYFQPNQYNPEHQEIDIWREATTIFMTSGHGGCGPRGLALAAWQRGFNAEVYINKDGPLFTDSVRSEAKKSVLQRVHERFKQKMEQLNLVVHHTELTLNMIKQQLEDGKLLVVLVSTWQFDKSKAPHWVVICAVDEHFVYINDPDIDDIPWLSTTERQYIPIEQKVFMRAFSYGKHRLKAAIAINPS